MKKGLALMVVLVMVFGSVGFAFALGPGIESDIHDGNVNQKVKCDLCRDLGLSASDLLLYSAEGGIIPDYLTWSGNGNTSGTLTNIGDSDIEIDHVIVKAGDYHYVISYGSGENILSANGGSYTVTNDKILNQPGNAYLGISHILVFGSVCEPQEDKYDVSFTINKEVTVKSGSPAANDFTFNVDESGSAIEVADQTITIPAGATSGSKTVNISDLTEDDFPFDLTISEENGGDNHWIYDDQQFNIAVSLDDQKNVIYNGEKTPGNITFTNQFSGSYELNIPIEKEPLGDNGFPDETFTFTATTTPGGTIVGTSYLTLTSDKAEKGNIEVSLPDGTKASDFPMMLMVTETAGSDSSWTYDESCYMVTVGLDGGVPAITDIEKMGKEHSITLNESGDKVDTIVFTNTYTAPLTFEIPFTKEVDGEKYGSETFRFMAQLIPDGSEEAVTADVENLKFSDGLTTTDGAFHFELTSTQAAAWLPAHIKIMETAGTSAGWDYDPQVFWAQVDKKGTVSDQFVAGQSTTESITFVNKYKGEVVEPIELQIPIKKIGTVGKGTFGSQIFHFDVSLQNGNSWEVLPGTSITLTYPNAMSSTANLKFTEDQLEEYIQNYGDPIVLKITEKNDRANYWTYDNKAYIVQIDNDNGNWGWNIGEAKEIVFNNSYNFTGGTGTKDDSEKPTYEIVDNEVPITDDPGDVDVISIPESEIPHTGGIGAAVFLALGGITAGLGEHLRKKDKR